MATKRRGCRGMVTFELAIGILSAMLVTTVLCWMVGLVTLHIRCADAASQVARYAARGDVAGVAQAEQRVPAGAQVQISQADGAVTVTVSAQSKLGAIGPVTMTGVATMPMETPGGTS
ncbi:MAG: hypothetical protein FWF75_08920 [Propionibacteriaceae bacterium]|nr:hypothetical protein [Propionibacteriaceae bacterium]